MSAFIVFSWLFIQLPEHPLDPCREIARRSWGLIHCQIHSPFHVDLIYRSKGIYLRLRKTRPPAQGSPNHQKVIRAVCTRYPLAKLQEITRGGEVLSRYDCFKSTSGWNFPQEEACLRK